MKKGLIVLLCVIIVLSLTACSGSVTNTEDDTTVTMTAVVTETRENNILVTPIESSDELNSSDCFDIPLNQWQSSENPEIGDIVEIKYSGEILESYPAGLVGITSVTIAEY